MISPDEVTWPDQALEPAVIGDALCLETWEDADDDCEHAAVAHWEGTAPAWTLAGTTTPGGVFLDAGRAAETEPPWFTDDAWALPPSFDWTWARSVDAMVRDIFGDLGLVNRDRPDPATPDAYEQGLRAALADARQEPALVTLDDVAGIFGPDWTGGMDSVAWVRAQRDDDDDPAVPPTVLFTHTHADDPDETLSGTALKEAIADD